MTVLDPRRHRPERGPEHDRVVIHEYDPEWPEYFRAAAGLLRALLGPHIGRIYHFGSTAVPGLAARPVVDMIIEVPSGATASHIVMPRLVCGGLEAHWLSDEEYWFCIQRHPVRPHRTHHLHLVTPGRVVDERLALRDFLRTHADVAARYAELKRRLVEQYPHDVEAYREAKRAFIADLGAATAGE